MPLPQRDNVIYQDDFKIPASPPSKNDPLTIHRRTREPADRAIIIFVHGFGGSRYTTWGNFPQFLFDDFTKGSRPELDLGFYEYRTAFRRLRFTRSITLEKEAGVLADILRDLTEYQKIILIVHSMGGILAKDAIANLIGRNDPTARTALTKIRGLIMLATPQAGSSWIPWFLTWLTKDTQVLANHNELLTRVDSVFNEHVVSRESDFRPDRVLIPTWVVLAAEDLWVGTFSARLGMNSGQQKSVHGSHTEIVKPERRNDAYVWVKDRIEEGLIFNPSALGRDISSDPVGHSISTVEKHVAALYEELWRAYRPVLQADLTKGLDPAEVTKLTESITAFALSGPHRREVLGALQQLRFLLQQNSGLPQLESSVHRFLDEIRRNHKEKEDEDDPCLMRALSHELQSSRRVTDATRAYVEDWIQRVKLLSEDVVTDANRVRASLHQNAHFDQQKAKALEERISRLVSNGERLLSQWSAWNEGGRDELIGWLTEGRQIAGELPGTLGSYRTELTNAIGPQLAAGNVYGKAKVVYEVTRQLLNAKVL